MKRIALFGCSGMLGNYVFHTLHAEHIVYCFSRKDFDIQHQGWVWLEERLAHLLESGDIVINCAGAIPQRYPNDAHYVIVNALFPNILARICAHHQFQLLHITTDCVYRGDRGDYVETDLPDDDAMYGLTKAAGEPQSACILRTSIIGEEIHGKKSLLEWVRSRKGTTIDGYANHWWNGVTCLTLARYLQQLIASGNYWTGVRHLYSETLTKFDLCSLFNQLYELNLCILPIETARPMRRTLKSNHADMFISVPLAQQLADQQAFNVAARGDSRAFFAPPSQDATFPFYVIHNLDPVRRKRLEADFLKFNVDHNHVKWLLYPNATDLSENTIQTITCDGRPLFPYPSKYPLRTGQIACTYKHYLALRDIAVRNYAHAVVMEDNVGLLEDMPTLLQTYLQQLPPNWSIVFDNTILAYIEQPTTSDQWVYPKSNAVTPQARGGSHGAAFYLVRGDTAKRLSAHFLPIGEVSDHWFNYLFRTLDIHSHWVFPPRIYIAPHVSTA